jgi:hypothetical protein
MALLMVGGPPASGPLLEVKEDAVAEGGLGSADGGGLVDEQHVLPGTDQAGGTRMTAAHPFQIFWRGL